MYVYMIIYIYIYTYMYELYVLYNLVVCVYWGVGGGTLVSPKNMEVTSPSHLGRWRWLLEVEMAYPLSFKKVTCFDITVNICIYIYIYICVYTCMYICRYSMYFTIWQSVYMNCWRWHPRLT